MMFSVSQFQKIQSGDNGDVRSVEFFELNMNKKNMRIDKFLKIVDKISENECKNMVFSPIILDRIPIVIDRGIVQPVFYPALSLLN